MLQIQYRTHTADMEARIPLIALGIRLVPETHIQIQSFMWFHLDNAGVHYGEQKSSYLGGSGLGGFR